MAYKDQRARTWTFVVYPESAPENWRDILSDYHIPWVESPLHDKDVNPDGEVKKAHWHIILFFDGKKSFEQVQEITDALNAPIPQKTANAKGLVRYLIHMDNPEKYQYKRDEIICHCGAEIDEYFALSASSKNAILWEIIEFIRENQVESLVEFMGYIQSTNKRDWFDVTANRNTMIIKAIIDSVYQVNHAKDDKRSEELRVREENIVKVKEMAEKGVSVRKIADTLGMSKSTVARYLHR
uniref:Uncharacterized protein n=1 Tax=uncultured prokaryote TaxID=198431 RepID=A0A0H5Q6R4_9ZZZZ|nr:hypothetical protein [uncultured prokaryote]